MHRDLTLNLALNGLDSSKPVGLQLPRHPDPDVRRDLTSKAPACGASAPLQTALDGSFLCSRSAGHPPPHVAGVSPLYATYIAEWDDDRTTDDPGQVA